MNIKTAFRSLNRNRLNSLIIISSLAIGMACFFLITIFIQSELNPESFNPDKNRIFALQSENPFGSVGGASTKMIHTRYGSAEFMEENFTEVESFCRLIHNSVKRVNANENAFFDQPVVINASSNFFDFFHYSLIHGSQQTALASKQDIVISKELAQKYFGDETPIGKPVQITFRNGEQNYFVSGVFEKPRESSQFKFDMVTLIGEQDSRCYLKLDSPLSKTKLEDEFIRLENEIPIMKGDNPNHYSLVPMTDAYFSTLRRAKFEVYRDKTDLWIALIVAIMIMGTAIFNYLTLIKNRLNDNIKNYTISRIQGAENKDLLRLFMNETLVLLILSFFAGFVLLKFLLPFFNQLLQTNLTFSVFIKVSSFLLFCIVLVFIAVVSYLFALVHIKNHLTTNNIKGNTLAQHRQISGLTVFQLVAMVVLVICSTVIIKQINFINNKEIGFNKNVTEIMIPLAYIDKATVFKEQLMANSAIEKLSLTPASPLNEHFILLLSYEESGEKKEYYPCVFSGDADFIETMGIKILEGDNFSGNPETDKQKCLVNKSFARLFPDRQLIGKSMPGETDKIIIGVVDDFHFSSLKNVIEPAYIEYNDQGPHILVKLQENRNKEVEAAIETIWNDLIPDYPVSYKNLDMLYQNKHAENKNFIRLIGSCCFISILLSMMGLFAISVDKCRKRVREIGIRKVNGAKIAEILALLNKDFVRWVMMAFVVAIPVSWFAMNKWLENFAYKTNLSWWIFALAGMLALGIALLTVSWQSWRAATRNPVEALRYE